MWGGPWNFPFRPPIRISNGIALTDVEYSPWQSEFQRKLHRKYLLQSNISGYFKRYQGVYKTIQHVVKIMYYLGIKTLACWISCKSGGGRPSSNFDHDLMTFTLLVHTQTDGIKNITSSTNTWGKKKAKEYGCHTHDTDLLWRAYSSGKHQLHVYWIVCNKSCMNCGQKALKDQSNLIQIYDVPMKFASKLIHVGPVHFCHRPL